ncbi:Os05g0561900 [Oryza sativa Japonica Group]|uniref:Os05g0561900 protein n=3 Tax=Oryza TaxID=4527 RepID=A0A0P0WQ83_ORYSJ|nr:hypothetical protein OsJ_19540 [Oryza sativa Japonica Group]BAF18231.1 Os05g0561900 [Oryza sativa Japonica Group]BAS95327.1 Os05g0561900 [Oryza sativa Japonica Group]|eukprot:NP_001056317.1 Os05g0561900 [Oryza sativa Japonica Group]
MATASKAVAMTATTGRPNDAGGACVDGGKDDTGAAQLLPATVARMADSMTTAADEASMAVVDGGLDLGDEGSRGGRGRVAPRINVVSRIRRERRPPDDDAGGRGRQRRRWGKAASLEEGFSPFFPILAPPSSSPLHPLPL